MLGIPRELPVADPAGVLEIAGIGLNDPLWFPKENKGMKVKRGKINGFMVQCAHKRQAPSDKTDPEHFRPTKSIHSDCAKIDVKQVRRHSGKEEKTMEKQKKIALINDLTGFGRCSTAVMAPIVSAMKIQAVVVPTAILSAHTQFPTYYFDDYTDRMKDYIQTYKDLKLDFDAISTGFLGSEQQVNIVLDFIRHFKTDNNFVIVDPVMGDYGKLYRTYTKEMCDKMKELVHYADIITPNLTELCTLLDMPYPENGASIEELKEMCGRLAERGPKHIVVTGIHFNQTQIANFIYNKGEDFQIVMVDRIGGDRSGTGDVIAAIIAGMYLNGHSLYESVKKAADYVSKCIRYCEENEVPSYWGLSFEMFMKDLTEEN